MGSDIGLRATQKKKGRHQGAVLGCFVPETGSAAVVLDHFLLAGRDISRRGVCAAAEEMVLAKSLFAALHCASLRYALGGT
jgi:hypothetical protein